MTQIISHPSWSTRPALEHAWGEPYLTPELSQTIQQTESALGMLCLMHRLTSLARYLVLALVGLLFLQWPLREWVHAYARQANDLGQIVFACYVAIAVTATSINNKHLAGNHKAGHLRAASRSAVGAMALCTLPWALFMVWAGWRPVMLAIQRAERFPESFSPGYYGISMAMALLVLLHLWHALFAVRLGNQAHT